LLLLFNQHLVLSYTFPTLRKAVLSHSIAWFCIFTDLYLRSQLLTPPELFISHCTRQSKGWAWAIADTSTVNAFTVARRARLTLRLFILWSLELSMVNMEERTFLTELSTLSRENPMIVQWLLVTTLSGTYIAANAVPLLVGNTTRHTSRRKSTKKASTSWSETCSWMCNSRPPGS